MAAASILWRRLDSPGHDACRLDGDEAGWRVTGTAVFLQRDAPARINYEIDCDPAWYTLSGSIRGWIGMHSVEYTVSRLDGGIWVLNGEAVTGLDECVDLDLSFTPATNLTQLRRVALAEGRAAHVPVVWLDLVAGTLGMLHQRYERRDVTSYWYEAPTVGYAALLEVGPDGFIRRYPGLWEAESL